MKTRYKYIHFTLAPNETKLWYVVNNKSGDWLGSVRWYPTWRRYVFTANDGPVWSSDCLRDIANFTDQLK